MSRPTLLKFSVWLNLFLLAGWLVSASLASKKTPPGAPAVPPATRPAVQARSTAPPFRWQQLESTNDYRTYVANLRAAGCPEATIEDIVRGDARRAFEFKRHQLGLDGSGSGVWSLARERALTASLLGQAATAETFAGNASGPGTETRGPGTAGNVALRDSSTVPGPMQTFPLKQPSPAGRKTRPVYPVAFREVNLAALGFNAAQKAAVDQVRQQFVSDIGGANQNPADPAYLARWQSAQSRADDLLRGLLGNQAFMAYQQQQYYAWFKPKIEAARAAGAPLTINPAAFSASQ
jgi:hypothetical protein